MHHAYHHNQRESHWSGLLHVMQKTLRTKERLRTQVLERRSQMRSHLDQTNAAVADTRCLGAYDNGCF